MLINILLMNLAKVSNKNNIIIKVLFDLFSAKVVLNVNNRMATALLKNIRTSILHALNDLKIFKLIVRNCALQSSQPNYLYFNSAFVNDAEKFQLIADMKVYEDFITEAEESSLFQEIEPYLKRMRYERNHWDNAIKGFRETERSKWNAANSEILDRVKKLAFKENTLPLKYVHVLDLAQDGVIMPHIDSVKFCGTTIAGISLLSDSVMRLVHDKDKTKIVDIFLKRRSLYIMTGSARYDYTHEILGNENSKFNTQIVKKSRRISVICRNEP